VADADPVPFPPESEAQCTVAATRGVWVASDPINDLLIVTIRCNAVASLSQGIQKEAPMPDRFLNAYDKARSLLMEAVCEKYASREQVATIVLGLQAIDVLINDASDAPLRPLLRAT
jgi:hypothetical protein